VTCLDLRLCVSLTVADNSGIFQSRALDKRTGHRQTCRLRSAERFGFAVDCFFGVLGFRAARCCCFNQSSSLSSLIHSYSSERNPITLTLYLHERFVKVFLHVQSKEEIPIMSTRKENEGLEKPRGNDFSRALDDVADQAAVGSAAAPSSPTDMVVNATSSSTQTTTPMSGSALSPYTYGKSPGSPDSDGVSAESAVAEGLMYTNHNVHAKSLRDGTYTVWVDETEGELPEDFLEDIIQKSFTLMIRRETEFEESRQDTGTLCQVVLVEGRDGVRRFITNKHVLKTKERTGTDGETEIHKVFSIECYRSKSMRSIRKVRFPRFENYQVEEAAQRVLLRDNVYWKTGVDIVWGTELTNQYFGANGLGANGLALVEARFLPPADGGHFSMVRDDFIITAGQKVGILVYNRYTVTTESQAYQKSSYNTEDSSINTAKLLTQFGPAGSMAIYCGEVSWVGEHHIEYGLNSSNGCSGAAVFLLDVRDQHFSVGENNLGKVIAIHAGYHPELGTNIGFKC